MTNPIAIGDYMSVGLLDISGFKIHVFKSPDNPQSETGTDVAA